MSNSLVQFRIDFDFMTAVNSCGIVLYQSYFITRPKPIVIKSDNSLHSLLMEEILDYLDYKTERTRDILVTPIAKNYEESAGIVLVINGSPARGTIVVPFDNSLVFGVTGQGKIKKSQRVGRGAKKYQKLIEASSTVNLIENENQCGSLFLEEDLTTYGFRNNWYPFTHSVCLRPGSSPYDRVISTMKYFFGIKSDETTEYVYITLCNGYYGNYAWGIIVSKIAGLTRMFLVHPNEWLYLGLEFGKLTYSKSYSKRGQEVRWLRLMMDDFAKDLKDLK